MKALSIKIARRTIEAPGYKAKRLEKINHNIALWISCESTSSFEPYRKYCRQMQKMYLQRYKFYLKDNKKSPARLKPQENLTGEWPQKAILLPQFGHESSQTISDTSRAMSPPK